MPDDPARSPGLRALAIGGLAALLVANLALLIIVWTQVWQEFEKPALLFVRSAGDLETVFSMYKDRIDNLQKMITALVGLSSLYSIVLGITAYLSAQKYVAEFEKTIADAKAQTKVLRRQLPILRGIDSSIRETLGRIDKQLPNTEQLADAYERLTDYQREELLHYERSMAFLEFLDPGAANAKVVSNLYQKLGKLCRVRYDSEKARLESAGLRIRRDRPEGSWCPEERTLYSLIDRAKLYANRSLEHNPDNYGTLTDLAVIEWKLSEGERRPEPFARIQESLKIQPHQQRPYYWMGLFHFELGKSAEKTSDNGGALKAYEASAQAFGDALGQPTWETKPVPELRKDILYNRACALSRRGKLEDASRRDELGRAAWFDLEQACPGPDQGFLETLKTDVQRDGDLAWLNSLQPDGVRALQSRLAGAIPPGPINVVWS